MHPKLIQFDTLLFLVLKRYTSPIPVVRQTGGWCRCLPSWKYTLATRVQPGRSADAESIRLFSKNMLAIRSR